jgi:antitoxin (DNA-binding transcriptional repressor) of toxin-antitoxin stability system
MTAIGSHQAKTHLAELLARVAQGEKFLITRRGVPVALLTLPPRQEPQDVQQVVEEMLAYRERRNRTLGDLTPRDLIEEGRRF